MKYKKGQVWIETTLYTLIGLAIIAMVLTYALPKITSYQEKIVIEQSINSMRQLDSLINAVASAGPGNRRSYDINFKTGELIFNGSSENVYFILKELSKPYSEVGIPINQKGVVVKTSQETKKYSTRLDLNYNSNNTDIATEDGAILSLPPSAVGYRIWVYHNGTASGKNQIVVSLN
ncbi:MAG: hypothetical protein AABX11_04025 [Nanoarchaeota archaeon]